MGVGVLKPREVRALRIGRDKFIVRNDACCSEEGASEEKNAFFLAFWTAVSDALLSSDEEATLSDSESFSSS
jgi:hypothetical protein